MALPISTSDVIEAESWGDFVNPLGFLYDEPNSGVPVAPLSLVGDREDGQERRVIDTETHLAAIRGQARVLAWSTPYGRTVEQNLRNYVIGQGCTYTVSAAKGVESQLPPGLIAGVQSIVDRFLDHNDWCGSGEREGELVWRSERDGETFVALSVQNGRIVSRIVDPEQVVEPQDVGSLEDSLFRSGVLPYQPLNWSFGITTPEGDVEQHLGYHVQWSQNAADSDWIPVTHIEHFKRNSDSNVKRGWSSFLPVLNDLQREAKLRKNTVEGAALQAAIAWIEEFAQGVTSGQANTISAANATGTRPIGIQGGGTRSATSQRYGSGTIIKVSAGKVWKPPPMGSERIPNFIAIAGYVLRAIGVNWVMPEYMISGDASNANYASTLVAESPFTKAREADQRFFTRRFRNIVWKAVKIAWQVGQLDRYGVPTESELERMLEIKVDAPAVATRDKDRETNRRKVLHDAGLMSRQTWSAEEGLDYDAESQAGAKAVETFPGFGMTQPHPQQKTESESVRGTEPATLPAASAAGPETEKSLASMALNGAQIASLVDLINQLTSGKLPMASAQSIIGAAFPMLDTTQVSGILEPLVDFKPASVAAELADITDAVRDAIFTRPFPDTGRHQYP